jgi:hypothetical protein
MLEVVFDIRNSPGNDFIRRDDEVKAAGDQANLGSDCCHRLYNLLNSRM